MLSWFTQVGIADCKFECGAVVTQELIILFIIPLCPQRAGKKERGGSGEGERERGVRGCDLGAVQTGTRIR